MKDQLQKLVAHGNVEDAINLLMWIDSDAVRFQARYNSGKKQYNMGLIDFGEWQSIQNQINFAILEMVANFPAEGRYERLFTKSGILDRVRLTYEADKYMLQVCDSNWKPVGEKSPLILSQFKLFTAVKPYTQMMGTYSENTGEQISSEEIEIIPYTYVGR
jgi:hypothetical protein